MKDIEAKKSLGQNFLTNSAVPEKMAEAGKITGKDTILEIGPGTGMLTRTFLAHGATVIAIEADPRAVEILHNTFPEALKNRKLILIHGDIREMIPEDIPLTEHEYTLIANIPYYLSGYLFRYFLSGKIQPKRLVFLVQKEVAERIARDPKESLLSLSVKAYGEPRYVSTVKRGNFRPQPQVDSAIIAVDKISKERFKEVPEDFFFNVLHLGFAAKRKMLLGNLAKEFDREMLEKAFDSVGISHTARGEDISIEIWMKLVHALYTASQQ